MRVTLLLAPVRPDMLRRLHRAVAIAAVALAVPSHPASAQSAERYRAAADRLIDAATRDTAAWLRIAELTDTFGPRVSGSAALERAIDWTLARAIRTTRFWWLALGLFGGLYAWYAVQVHQTKYLLDIGFTPGVAAWALGMVSLFGVPGQIFLGHLSDRIGREWIWTVSGVGFAICFASLIALESVPSLALVYVMVISQGLLGYGVTSIMGAVVSEIFQGEHFGSIFGTLMLAALAGGAAGPLVTGVLHDHFGTYTPAFALGIAVSFLATFAVWMASPGKVRAVAGRLHRAHGAAKPLEQGAST